MSHTTAVPTTTASLIPRSGTGRAVRFGAASIAPAAMAAAMLVAAISTAGAQDAAARPSVRSRFEFIVADGALLPTGDQRNALKNARMNLAQLSYAVRPYLAVTTSMGWARTRDIASVNTPKLNVFTYDVGAELRADRWMTGKALTFTPFAGAGAGGRSYNYRSLDVDATHNLAAYGSAGGELGYRRIRFRVEARDYVTGFKPLQSNGATERRNDVSVMGGFRIATR